MLAAAVPFTPAQDVVAPPSSKLSTSWQELGFRLPDGYPTDMIPLFEALNESRGAWSFAG
ncbi:MAG: hypothetical protein P8J87_12380 [Verrucomicrobiales bacterium]|nr:hypothetical protein [Verrucomicrobiales bacterium]